MTVEPPRLVRQLKPTVSPNVMSMLKKKVTIHIRGAHIDAAGKVTSAQPVSVMPGINEYLAATAAVALRLAGFSLRRDEETRRYRASSCFNSTFSRTNEGLRRNRGVGGYNTQRCRSARRASFSTLLAPPTFNEKTWSIKSPLLALVLAILRLIRNLQ